MTKLTVYQGSVPNKKTMNKSVFALSVHGWLAYISSAHAPQMNTVIDEIDAAVLSIENFAQTAEESANATNLARDAAVAARDVVLVSVNSAQNAELAAAASAASAAAIAGAFAGTSTTSLLIEIGSKTFSTQLGEQYTDGIWLTAVSAANATNWMYGQVTSYNTTTGALVLDIQAIGGSGTFADWNLSLTGVRGAQGPAGATFTGGNLTSAINHSKASVASHATTANIWGALGNQIDWTGTATTTMFPNAPQAGAERTLICAGACSFTAGTNLLINGVASGATITCAAGDQVTVTALSTTQFRLNRIKQDGTSQVSSAGGFSSTVILTSGTSWVCPTGVTKIRVSVTGAGGSAANESETAGGGGATAIKTFTVVPSTSYSYTVGAAPASAEIDGGNTTFTVGGVTITGGGGKTMTNIYTLPAPSVATNGDINIGGGMPIISKETSSTFRSAYGGASEKGMAIATYYLGSGSSAVPAGYGQGGSYAYTTAVLPTNGVIEINY